MNKTYVTVSIKVLFYDTEEVESAIEDAVTEFDKKVGQVCGQETGILDWDFVVTDSK